MRKSLKRMLSLILVVAMLAGLLTNLTFASAAEADDGGNYVAGIGDASNIKRDGPADVEWSAKWIWSADNTSMHNWLCMRKTVDLEQVPSTAEARISIDSRYWLWVNGEMVVYEGGVKRGPNSEDSYFDTVDIAPYLQKGKNTIAILGWYFGNDSDYYSYNSSGAAGFLFEADLGGVKVISDNTWKVHKEDGYLLSTKESDPGSQPNYRLPEENIFYDARKAEALEGWYLPSFDDSEWKNATEYGKVGDAPWYNLWQRSIPLLKWSEIKAYENPDAYAAYKDTATTSAVEIGMNLPYNMQMQPYLKVEAPAGLKIQMLSDGAETVRTSYITKDGVQEFEGLGWMSTQTLKYQIPAGVKVLELGYRQTGYNAEFEGSFTSDDEFFNRLWQESIWTLYITMRDTYMDCPDRERAQWWGDATNESQETFYALDTSSYLLYRKGVDTVINWRGQTGSKDDRVLCTVVPINQGHFELPAQQLAGVVGFWTYYLYTGEQDFLQEVYEPALTYLTCWTMNDSGLVNHRPGSWDWMDWGDCEDVVVMENAWYYWAASCVLKMAEALHADQEDIDFLTERMGSIQAAYPSLWTENGYYKNTKNGKPDDRGNALAVLSGLATPGQYETIKDVLVGTYNASPYMEKYVLDALYAMDYQTEALDRMKARYGAMVNDEWTTLWELFGNPGGGTHNHAWSGGPLISMSGNVAGVYPETPGYETYHVIPQLGYLNQVDCTVPSVKGDIMVDIDRDLTAETYSMTLTSPEGTVARVAVPRFEGKNTVVSVNDTVLFQDGKAAGTVAGVEYESNDDQYIYFNVQPGTLTLKASVKAPVTADTYTVSIDATEGGYVTINGERVETPFSMDYAANTSLKLAAVADDKMELTHWSGTYGFAESKVTLDVRDNVSLTANFAKKTAVSYKVVSIANPAGTDVQVQINGKTRELPTSVAVKEGESISITAVDGKMWDFANWEGDLFSAEKTLVLDEVTSKINLTIQGSYKGSALGNMSLGAKVTVDDEYVGGDQWRASNLTDGVKLNDGGCTTMQWYSAESDGTDRPTLTNGVLPEPAKLTIDLGKAKTFDTFRIYPRGAYDANGNAVNFIVDYSVQVSNDGNEWTTIYEKTGQANPGDSFVELTFGTQTARYIRLSVTKLGEPYKEGWNHPVYRLQLSELEVYNEGSQPTTGTVTIQGTEGGGTVLVNGVEQALPYTATYDVGTVLAVEAQNNTNYKFTGWSGDLNASDKPVYLTVMSDIELFANFTSTVVKELGISDNLALGKKVTSSVGDIDGVWKVENLTDGKVTMPSGGGNGFSTGNLGSAELTTPVDITLDFGSNVDFNSVKFYPRNGVYTADGGNCHFPTSFKVYVMMDGESVWREMATFTNVTSEPSEPLEVKFPLQNARYMKISVTKVTKPASDEGGSSPIYRIQMAEIEAYLSPLTPENLAIGGTVTSNDSLMESATWSCANLLDGKLRSEGRNLTTGIKGFTSRNYNGPELQNPIWVNVKLPEAKTVNQVILYPRSDIDAIAKDTGITPNFPTKYDIQIKNASGDYVTVKSVDYGSADYNINSAPQVIDFDQDVNTTDVRLMVYRLGQPTWDEQTGDQGAYRLQLCEFQVGYVPGANADQKDIAEGAIDVTPTGDPLVVKDATVLTAAVTKSDLPGNDIIWSVENADGTVSNVATLLSTLDTDTVVVPGQPGEAYVVARMNNGLKTISKTKISVPEPILFKDILVSVDGADMTTVDNDEVSYTVSAKNMVNTATVTIKMTLSDCVTDPEFELLNGWFKIIEAEQDGVLTIIAGNNDGVTSDEYEDILKVTAKTTGQTGDATLTLTKVRFSAYTDDSETYVNAILEKASATTKITYSKYDVNHDGVVDQLDLTRTQRYYGLTKADAAFYPDADVDGNGVIDIADMILILNNYTVEV